MPDFQKMQRLSADIRIETIKSLTRVGYGHIGGAMSIADVLGVLYGGVMNVRPEQPDWPDRDYFVLSKGHSGPGLYAALALCGFFPMEWLATINTIGTNLPSHCDRQKTPGIDMTTGSLGQGISAAVGIALGNKVQKRQNYTYCIVGDGECNEGQVWEAMEAAVERKLDHLIVFVDWNKHQLDGALTDVLDPIDLHAKFSAFGAHTQTVTGYDAQSIYAGIETAKAANGRPSVILLDTIKGLGCSFAEGVFNHYMNMDWDMANAAIQEIERRLQQNCYPRGDFRW